ncbi:MAG: Ig-like domain-containing protein [Maritimibacter sp.]
MSAIQFVVRGAAGNLQHGAVIDSDIDGTLSAGPGSAVSLNIRRADVRDYVRAGTDLEIYLSDGRRLVLEDYFDQAGMPNGQLFLSEGGVLMEVSVSPDGQVDYQEATAWGKWSELDSLTFPDDPIVAVEAYTDGEEVAQGIGLGLAPLAGLGANALPAAAGLAGLAGLGALLGGTDGNGDNFDGNQDNYIAPTVNEAGDTNTYNGASDLTLDVTGTADPGSEIVVQAGDKIQTTTADEEGNWAVNFDGEDFPEDGEHIVRVKVTEPGGAEHMLDGPAVNADTVAPDVEITGFVGIEDDGVVNAEEYDAGFQLEGTGEAGATLTVDIDGVVRTTTIGEDGTWSVTYNAGDLPNGEYTTGISVTATDSYDNSNTISGTLNMDTVAPSIEFGPAEVAGDGVVNASEANSKVEVTGLAEPGSMVVVSMEGYSFETVATSQGTWTAQFPADAFANGTYDATLTAVATDAAGNSTTTTSTIHVDTENTATINPGYAGDETINKDEADSGVVFSGSGEPGAAYIVEFEGATHTGTVAENGTWTVTFAPGEIPSGEYTSTLTLTATDSAGNVSVVTEDVTVDTVTSITADVPAMGSGDPFINHDEMSAGVELSGTAQPGAQVQIKIGQTAVDVQAGANGAWVATFPVGSIAPGEYEATVTSTAQDAAGNTATTTDTIKIDTLVTDFAFTGQPASPDGVLSASDISQGLTITGTVEQGSSVSVTIAGVTRPASLNANGTWDVTFEPGVFQPGEYQTTLTVTATDLAKNTSSLTEMIEVDTVAGQLALSTAAIEIDDIINNAERLDDGVTIEGTATPGMLVTVNLGGATGYVVSSAQGTWSYDFAPGEVPPGTYMADISASITDQYGNTKEVTDTVKVDTEVENFTIKHNIEGDDVISGAEAANGVRLEGTVEAGSEVTVTFGSEVQTVMANGSGVWKADFSAAQIPAGEVDDLPITVMAKDPAGNKATITHEVDVDTVVSTLNHDGPVSGDGYINAAEAAAGVELSGQVEVGSEVWVTLAGERVQADVSGRGSWTVTFNSGQIGTGEHDLNVLIEAEDAAGNTATLTDQVTLDTVAPDEAYITSYTRSNGTLRGFSVEVGDAAAQLTTVDASGAEGDIAHSQQAGWFSSDEVDFRMNEAVADGDHLVVTKSDDAGNTNSTLFAMEGTTDQLVLDGIVGTDLNFEAIDLRFAEDTVLEINAQTLEDLSVNSNALTIHGSADDSVHIDTSDGSTLVKTTNKVTIENETYDVYTLGDEGGTLIIDDEIQIV